MRQRILFDSNFGRRVVLAMVAGIILAAVPVIAGMQESKFSDQSIRPTEKFSRPTFDTVSIRKSKLSEDARSLQTGRSGISFKAVSLGELITWAFRPQEHWDLYKLGNDLGARYDITAQGPPGSSPQLMVRSLLEDRFKLKVHHELRLEKIYTLEISKSGPKLTPSSGGPSVVRREKDLVVFTHASMEMLCEFLSPNRDAPLFDQTGLKGFYDFKLNLPLRQLDDWELQTDVNMRRQIGLELKSGKMQLDHLVVDYVEKPSLN